MTREEMIARYGWATADVWLGLGEALAVLRQRAGVDDDVPLLVVVTPSTGEAGATSNRQA